jgi:hypothetical protein
MKWPFREKRIFLENDATSFPAALVKFDWGGFPIDTISLSHAIAYFFFFCCILHSSFATLNFWLPK